MDDQGQRQEPVRDGAAERSRRGALGVDVHELMVFRNVSERIDAALIYREPVRGAEMRSDEPSNLLSRYGFSHLGRTLHRIGNESGCSSAALGEPGHARALRFLLSNGGIRVQHSFQRGFSQVSTVAKIGFVSLGCPKALVDSERILTRLSAEGYETASDYAAADLVVVNTCGFLDSAREESLASIGEALTDNGRVIVTGCLGARSELIRERYPNVLAVTGPQQYDAVVDAIHRALPPPHNPFVDLVPSPGVRLTPDHYAYLKIAEGCNNRCSFCIIPGLRGPLVSRPVDDVLREAEELVASGVRELVVISQDTGAYGRDLDYAERNYHGHRLASRIVDLCAALGGLGVWVRLHYVYPYRHIDRLIPLMADGALLPYLDIPFQHSSPAVLKAMRRPAAAEQTLERIRMWRKTVPDLTLRSSFIVGFPGETEHEFELLLQWLDEARLDRVGCFRYEPVSGAASNELENAVPTEVIDERWHRFMQTQEQISRHRLAALVGRDIDVIVDTVSSDAIIGRSKGDAPEIDGRVYLPVDAILEPGDIVTARVEHSDTHDLWADPLETRAA
jgi:ribosomal protein S12 methylthiotransferase